ncbi:MAG: hypothetical protein COB49_00690 [Alphaproteobacteria bacterium]|nr:MAG: hypothetical protein COB49_00690 [Alphaproteobacteria bacterium]
MSNRVIENIHNRDILAEIINLSADAVISLDVNHHIVLVNAAFEKTFGYSEDEILGQSLNLLLPESVHSRHGNFIEAYDKSGEKSRYMGQRTVLYGISKSGAEIPLDIAIQKHPEGSLCRYTAICRDISNRLEQQKRVREEEAKFRTLFNMSHQFTILMNGEGEVMEFNDTVVRLLKAAPEKNIGRKVWDCDFWASEKDFSLVQEAVSQIKPGKSVSLTVDILGANNRKIILAIILKEIWVEYKQSRLIVLEGKDVTEIRKSNRALVESEARLARAQKTARFGNFEWIMNSNEFIWSDEIYNIFGLSADTFSPDYESFMERVHPDDRATVDSSVISALKGDHSYELSHRILLSDKSEKMIKVRGKIFRMEDGMPIRMEGTIQDITVSWNREQELLLAKRRAEEANIAKVQFLSAVSHELRTPLNAIIGFSSMIAEEHMGKINIPFYRDYAVDINTGGKQLLELIQNILHVTNFELGSVKDQPRHLSAQSLLDEIMPRMINRAAEKNITIETSVSSDMAELYIDPDHTMRILVHLIDNAIKFSEENAIVKVDLYYKKGEFIIDVIDQGIGLEDVDKGMIFDLFVQKDMNFNRIYGGVGLGLTIVKNLVELQGGRIQVESNAGPGSRFSVYFSNAAAEAVLTPEIGRIDYKEITIGHI